MKKTIVFFGALLTVLVLTQTSIAQVKSDYNKEADFSKYKTYTFAGWQEDSEKQINQLDKDRIQKAIRAEFDKRGMEFVESDGDAIITLFIVFDQKTSTTAYTNYNGGMGYGGRWGWGYGGMGSSTTTYSESDYIEGTLVIDMYDSESKDLQWQGIITSTVKDNPKKREKTIPKKIAKLMKQYPGNN